MDVMILVDTLHCSCGCEAFSISQRALSCISCGTALGFQFKKGEMGHLDVDIADMQGAFTREPKKFKSQEEYLESLEIVELTAKVIRKKANVPAVISRDEAAMTPEQVEAVRGLISLAGDTKPGLFYLPVRKCDQHLLEVATGEAQLDAERAADTEPEDVLAGVIWDLCQSAKAKLAASA